MSACTNSSFCWFSECLTEYLCFPCFVWSVSRYTVLLQHPRWQQAKHGFPNILLTSYVFQLLLWDLKLFTGKRGYMRPPVLWLPRVSSLMNLPRKPPTASVEPLIIPWSQPFPILTNGFNFVMEKQDVVIRMHLTPSCPKVVMTETSPSGWCTVWQYRAVSWFSTAWVGLELCDILLAHNKFLTFLCDSHVLVWPGKSATYLDMKAWVSSGTEENMWVFLYSITELSLLVWTLLYFASLRPMYLICPHNLTLDVLFLQKPLSWELRFHKGVVQEIRCKYGMVRSSTHCPLWFSHMKTTNPLRKDTPLTRLPPLSFPIIIIDYSNTKQSAAQTSVNCTKLAREAQVPCDEQDFGWSSMETCQEVGPALTAEGATSKSEMPAPMDMTHEDPHQTCNQEFRCHLKLTKRLLGFLCGQ